MARNVSKLWLFLVAATCLTSLNDGSGASPWQELPPELRISGASNGVALSWPTWAFNYRVEASDDIRSPSNWRMMPFQRSAVGNEIVATVPATNEEQFFRLSWGSPKPLFPSIPLFQFAIFYNGDLELNGAATLHVRGRVHGNANIYTGSNADQYFYDDVTTSGINSNGMRYGWGTNGTVYYYSGNFTNVPRLALAMSTNIAPEVVREIIQMPPTDEPIDSPMGRERYYNKAELVIQVTDTDVFIGVKQPYTSNLANIDWLAATNFLSTNKTFTDQREAKLILTTEINVARFGTWASTNSTVIATLGVNTPPNLIYVRDDRTTSPARLAGVRLVNGQMLSARGLTVATPNPLYTKGHYNQPTTSHLGTTNTGNTKPASLVCDAYTLLSGSFSDTASSGSYSSRVPDNTTVVAAIVAGNSPSGRTYSGGPNNLPRLLEAWSGRTYTLNGSLVCLFPSAVVTAPFQNPGVYYSAPTRNINFDPNFLDIYRLPPGAPTVRVVAPGE